jgi:hypothetical protein
MYMRILTTLGLAVVAVALSAPIARAADALPSWHDGADAEPPAPSTLGRDWGGIGRDTALLLGYQVVTVGVLYVLPESVTKWTAEQKHTGARHWWENVQQPVWDRDHWAINYIGHPYFGAIYYTYCISRCNFRGGKHLRVRWW